MNSSEAPAWYVLRDLKPANSHNPAYCTLASRGVQVYTPMHWVLRTARGTTTREHIPVVRDLLFVRGLRSELDPVIASTPRLQYRYRRGAGPGAVMTVAEADMQRFMAAVDTDPEPIYLTPDELTPDMIGREIIVTGGPLDGYRGHLLKMQGSRNRRLLVSIPALLTAAISIQPPYIKFA